MSDAPVQLGPRQFRKCRTVNHAFQRRRVPRHEIPLRQEWPHYLTLYCPQCTTWRYDGIDHFGDVGERRYVYPPEYRYSTGPAPSRRFFRLALVQDEAEGPDPDLDQGAEDP